MDMIYFLLSINFKGGNNMKNSKTQVLFSLKILGMIFFLGNFLQNYI